MRKTSFLLLLMVMVLVMGSCKKEKPTYIYVYGEYDESNQPKPVNIDAEDDLAAFYKAFEKYAKDRHYEEFKLRMPIETSSGGEEACESDEFDQVNGAEPIAEGVELITGGDSEEASEYIYQDLEVNNPPNFKVYKITDSKVTKDLESGLITLNQLESDDKIKDKVEVVYDNVQRKGVFEKEFTKCKEIDKNAYVKMREDFNKRVQAANSKKEQQ